MTVYNISKLLQKVSVCSDGFPLIQYYVSLLCCLLGYVLVWNNLSTFFSLLWLPVVCCGYYNDSVCLVN